MARKKGVGFQQGSPWTQASSDIERRHPERANELPAGPGFDAAISPCSPPEEALSGALSQKRGTLSQFFLSHLAEEMDCTKGGSSHTLQPCSDRDEEMDYAADSSPMTPFVHPGDGMDCSGSPE